MNALTAKFDLAEELVVTGTDIIDCVEEHTQDVELFQDKIDTINLQIMVDDFSFVRDTLRETIENGRKVLNSVTLDLLDSEDDKRASLILSFAELNKAVTDSSKLYMGSYKEISNILLNLDKLKKEEGKNPKNITTNNTVNINTVEPMNTVDIIKQLQGSKKN